MAALIYVLGAPASGKGTLCSRLSKQFGFLHISVGDHLRAIKDERPDIGKWLDKSDLLPSEIIIPILKDRLDHERTCGNMRILLDGFPRRLDQALVFEREFQKPDLVIFFDCPEEIARERFLSRKIPGRLQDDEQVFSKRFDEFSRNNPSIVEHYQKHSRLIQISTHKDTDATYHDLVTALGWRQEAGDLRC